MSESTNANLTSTPTNPANLMNGAGEPEFSIEDLVDPQLRVAVEKQDNGDEGDTHVSNLHGNPKSKAQLPKTKTEDTAVDEEEDDSASALVESEEDAVADDELDLSDENIEELLKGDDSKVKAKKAVSTEIEEDDSPWKKETEYTDLAQRLSFNGATTEALDTLIKKAVDSSIINNSAITNGYRDKVKTLEKNTELLGLELKRLKQIEHNAYFDNAEDTKVQFDMPMSAAAAEISKVLQIEGAEISASKILNASNRVELTKLLGAEVLDDDAILKITNQWKVHTQLKNERYAAKEDAKKNLQQGLSTKVDDKKATAVYQNSLGDILENKDAVQYNYIREAVDSGDYENPKHSLAKQTLLQSQRDHKSLLQALGSPADHVNNPDWMSKLTKFLISSAHARNMLPKIPELEAVVSKKTELIGKLTKEVLRLRGSGKGITGISGGDLSKTKSSKSSKTEDANALKRFKDFNANKLDIEDLLGLTQED